MPLFSKCNCCLFFVFYRRSNRASVSACAAFDAFVSVDFEFVIAFGNAGNGAVVSASTAFDAIIVNFKSHDKYLHVVIGYIVSHIPKNAIPK